jgi:hypothetical protein
MFGNPPRMYLEIVLSRDSSTLGSRSKLGGLAKNSHGRQPTVSTTQIFQIQQNRVALTPSWIGSPHVSMTEGLSRAWRGFVSFHQNNLCPFHF